MREILGDGVSWVEYYPGFLGNDIWYMDKLKAEVKFEEREIIIYGKVVKQPRLMGWGGTKPYRYSGQELEVREMGDTMMELMGKMWGNYNHVLVNWYRDGNDSIGMHSDDERDLGIRSVIASLSLGERRKFEIEGKGHIGRERMKFDLGCGDLLIMGGDIQSNYSHGIRKNLGVIGERMNLTFREIK